MAKPKPDQSHSRDIDSRLDGMLAEATDAMLEMGCFAISDMPSILLHANDGDARAQRVVMLAAQWLRSMRTAPVDRPKACVICSCPFPYSAGPGAWPAALITIHAAVAEPKHMLIQALCDDCCTLPAAHVQRMVFEKTCALLDIEAQLIKPTHPGGHA